jgi:hypothetical protein
LKIVIVDLDVVFVFCFSSSFFSRQGLNVPSDWDGPALKSSGLEEVEDGPWWTAQAGSGPQAQAGAHIKYMYIYF